MTVRHQGAVEDGRALRDEMPEPCRPGAVVGDPAEAGNQLRGHLGIAACQPRLAFVDDRLVESGASASRLIDDVAWDAVADEVGIPTLASIRRRLEARSRVRRPVHHDHRPSAVVLLCRDLELDVHLADRDLLWRRRLRRRSAGRGRSGSTRVVGDLGNAADEEASLVFDDERAAKELLWLLA